MNVIDRMYDNAYKTFIDSLTDVGASNFAMFLGKAPSQSKKFLYESDAAFEMWKTSVFICGLERSKEFRANARHECKGGKNRMVFEIDL